MTKPSVLLLCPLMPFVVKTLEERYEIKKLWLDSDPQAFLKTKGKDFTVAVTQSAVGISRETIESLPNLEAIISYGVGYETIDIKAAREHSIIVTNTAKVLDDCVADCAIGLLLATSRLFIQADRFVREGRWLKSTFPMGLKVSGKRSGIVGLGNIGLTIAKRLEGFDNSISYFGRHEREDVPKSYRYYYSLVDMAQNVDFLIVAVSGGPSTRYLISGEVLKALGPHGILINIARGSVVDENALIHALENKLIRGAGLDVFEKEPQVPQALLEMNQVVLLPHIASGTQETREAMAKIVWDNLDAFFRSDRAALRSIIPQA